GIPRIFVSSAMLPRFRSAAIDAVWRCGLYPSGMEQGSARPEGPVEVSQAWTYQADVYVGILAHRDREITRMEVRSAGQRNISILIFCAKLEEPFDETDMDNDAERQHRLLALKDELSKRYVIGYFGDQYELAFNLVLALFELQRAGKLPTTSRAGNVHAR